MLETFITLSVLFFNNEGLLASKYNYEVTIPISKISTIRDTNYSTANVANNNGCRIETPMKDYVIDGTCKSTILKRLNVK